MRNIGRVVVDHTARTPAASEAWLAVWLGYCHGAGDKPYPGEYDQLTKDQQLNYERGRAIAAAMRGHGLPTPPWNVQHTVIDHLTPLAALRTINAMGEDLALFDA